MGSPRQSRISVPDEPLFWAYVAGIWDGEGTVSIGRVASSQNYSHSLMVQISNTNEDLINLLLERIGGKAQRRERQENWRTCYAWQIYADNAEAFLRAVQPYVVIKKEQVEVALKFRTFKTTCPLSQEIVDGREWCRERIMALNSTATNSDLAVA